MTVPARPRLLSIDSINEPSKVVSVLERWCSEVTELTGVDEAVISLAASSSPTLVTSHALSTSGLAAIVHAAASHEVPVGFVLSWVGDELAAVHAKKICVYQPKGIEQTLVWSAFGSLGPSSGMSSRLTWLRRNDEALLDALGSYRRLTCIESHGNGLDAPIAGRLFCAAVDQPAPLDVSHSSLPCFHAGPCIRGDQQRLSAAVIRADVLFWASCWGVLASDSTFNPSISLARQLLLSDYCGALITTITAVTMPPQGLLQAAHMLMSGATVGETVMTLNREAIARGEWASWLVLGDPNLCAFAKPDAQNTTMLETESNIHLRPGINEVITPYGTETLLLHAKTGTPTVARRIGLTNHFLVAVAAEGDARFQTQALVAREANELELISGIVNSLPYLVWTERFVSRHPQTGGHRPDTGMEQDIMRMVDMIARHAAVTEFGSHLSGSPDRLRALASRFSDRWDRLHDGLHRYLLEYNRNVGSILERTYHDECRVNQIAAELCPYCGNSVSVTSLESTTTAAIRRVATCRRCSYISDGSERWHTPSLEGPEVVRLGAREAYRLRMDRSNARGASTGRASLDLQRVAFPIQLAAPTVRLELSERQAKLDVTLEFEIPVGTPPGAYYLLALLVIDSELQVVRRPISLRR